MKKDNHLFPCLSLDEIRCLSILASSGSHVFVDTTHQADHISLLLPVLASSHCRAGCVYCTVRTGHHMQSLRVSGGIAAAQKGKPPGFLKTVTLQNLILQKLGKDYVHC